MATTGSDFYFKKCMEFACSFGKEELYFKVKIGSDFLFTVNHRGKDNQPNKPKYVSPSTRRRNAARLLAFKAKRAEKGVKGPTRSGAPPSPLTRKFRVGWEM